MSVLNLEGKRLTANGRDSEYPGAERVARFLSWGRRSGKMALARQQARAHGVMLVGRGGLVYCGVCEGEGMHVGGCRLGDTDAR